MSKIINKLNPFIKPTPSILSAVFLLFIISGTEKIVAQGCSDAGVCSVNSMVPGNDMDSVNGDRNLISTGIIFGMSQYDVLAFTPYLEYTRSLGSHLSLSGKVNYGFRDGELGSVNSLSDIFLSAGYNFLEHFSVTGGVKIPMNDGNKTLDGNALPMNYQTSLGTVDLLLGFGYTLRRFSIMAGYQQPLTQNKNQFLANDYAPDDPENKYFSTRNYHRAADAMLRLSYIAVQSRKINLVTSLLPIYHILHDSYEDPDGKRVTLSGSQGLTLNVNVILKYHITNRQSLELNLGAPALARSVRPDGLSKFAIAAGYIISF